MNRLTIESIYTDKCIKCGSDLISDNGWTYDRLPVLYPVKCINCGEKTHSELKSERDYFNKVYKDK